MMLFIHVMEKLRTLFLCRLEAQRQEAVSRVQRWGHPVAGLAQNSVWIHRGHSAADKVSSNNRFLPSLLPRISL